MWKSWLDMMYYLYFCWLLMTSAVCLIQFHITVALKVLGFEQFLDSERKCALCNVMQNTDELWITLMFNLSLSKMPQMVLNFTLFQQPQIVASAELNVNAWLVYKLWITFLFCGLFCETNVNGFRRIYQCFFLLS